MKLPKRLHLARLNTPIALIAGLSKTLATPLWVKRDDLTGSHLSGNKIRKLEFLLADAQAQQATHIITCGGIQSNHARATALAAAPLGMTPVLLLRTPNGRPDDIPAPPTGNLLLNQLVGAQLRLCTPDGYQERDAIMAAMADDLRAQGARPYIIPEGGSNALGCFGYIEAAREILDATPDAPPTTVFVPTGSGGTLAGLALGFKALGAPTKAIGIAVCDDRTVFRNIVDRLAAEAADRFGLPALDTEDYDVLDGYQGHGYAQTSPDEMAFLRESLRTDGLALDPVYTNKAFLGAADQLRDPGHAFGARPMIIHTGGLFGLFGAGAAIAATAPLDVARAPVP